MQKDVKRYYLNVVGLDPKSLARRIEFTEIRKILPFIPEVTSKMRLPYVQNPPQFDSSSDAAILGRILERRGSNGLLELDLAFLHAPAVADGFNSFMKALRTQTSLAADYREVAFCSVASLTGCWYEWDIHAPIAEAAGVPRETLSTLKAGNLTSKQVSGTLAPAHAAIAQYAEEMTTSSTVSEHVYQGVRAFLTDREMVELTASIAGFNAVCKFVVALDVGEKNVA